MKPLLVGECYDGECLGLDTPSGFRLCAIMGVDPDDYLERYVRRNLCSTDWAQEVAVAAAKRIAVNAMYRTGPDRIVLLGRRVADAFKAALESMGVLGLTKLELLEGYCCVGGARDLEVVFVVLPHPSGKSRVWNDPKSLKRARALLIEAEVIPATPVFVPRKRVGRHGK